jgi:hypothetical protein
VQQFTTVLLLRDRDGNLWIGTSDAGLVHVHKGRTDAFAQTDRLTGDLITALFIDREGTIWVATGAGLDRFRETAVATLSLNQGLSNATILSVLADRDGSVWLSTRRGLNRWNKGQITIFGKSSAPAGGSAHGMTGSDQQDAMLNGTYPGSQFQDSRGRIWVSTIREFGYLENGRFVRPKTVPRGVMYSSPKTAPGICGSPKRNSVWPWRLISCDAASGLDSTGAASPISMTVRSALVFSRRRAGRGPCERPSIRSGQNTLGRDRGRA